MTAAARCPRCGRGRVRLDRISGLTRCTACGARPPTERVKRRSSSAEDVVQDAHRTKSGVFAVASSYFCPKVDAEPREVDEGWARFHKWRLAALASEERKWGAQDLRRRALPVRKATLLEAARRGNEER